jgi:hypothetical protein
MTVAHLKKTAQRVGKGFHYGVSGLEVGSEIRLKADNQFEITSLECIK